MPGLWAALVEIRTAWRPNCPHGPAQHRAGLPQAPTQQVITNLPVGSTLPWALRHKAGEALILMEHSRRDPESKQREPTTVREGVPKLCRGHSRPCVCVRGPPVRKGVTSRWGERQASLALCRSGDPRGGRALVQDLRPPAAWTGLLGRLQKPRGQLSGSETPLLPPLAPAAQSIRQPEDKGPGTCPSKACSSGRVEAQSVAVRAGVEGLGVPRGPAFTLQTAGASKPPGVHLTASSLIPGFMVGFETSDVGNSTQNALA